MDRAFIDAIPKAELHLHIEGTIEPDHAFRMADRNGVELPWAGARELAEAYAFDDLQSFLDVYYAVTAVLQTRDDFTEIAESYFARAARQGVRHAEIFFDPQSHTSRGVDIAVAIEGLWAAVSASSERHGLTSSLILCFLRDRGAAEASTILESAVPFLDLLSGVGLDSAEVGHPPAEFEGVFARAAELGLRRVAHAGEEGPPEYVWQALDALGAERIDHGVRSLEDPRLLERLVREQVPLTVCPFSNVRLKVVSDLVEHPIERMLHAGLLVSINSDDPAYFGGYVGDNFAGLAQEAGLDAGALRVLAENSFHSSFLDEDTRARHLAAVRDHFESNGHHE
ncbi:adenosine deaminase [Herbiconiux sp. CPCC 205716]|uniref:Adenine deaminase n=1 Tax=Herbiconiux gentiana TaxID=2970912 RepID=A0ABT2GH90_9MICO|nr:adenosine deaminase [Herbiconiux gentiana]MCS5714166.1 adenosine deaminase [Herbiconiux gentiana]